jgi:hypothetical protein
MDEDRRHEEPSPAFGARAAYAAASLDATRVRKLVGLAVPYGKGLPTAFVADGDQQQRSWYMFFFQTRLAETAVQLNDFAFLDRLWREWSPGYVLPPADRSARREPFAAGSYRARRPFSTRERRTVRCGLSERALAVLVR